jgi:hypothetical protein
MQEALHGEAVEHAVELQVPPLRVTQVQQTRNHLRRLARQFHSVNRGVVLHLRSRFVRHAIAAGFFTLAQAQLAQDPRQRGIADLDTFFLGQLLMHPLNPAVTFVIQPLQQLRVDVDLVLADHIGHRSLLPDNRPHRVAADLEAAADLPQRHPRQV